ncbi:peptidylprolyl isomerase [Cytophagaceae bacterium YF14B1]|uniref:peptidylprolyl isomerase n=1 Tax=Xanthocytophaga flava TaxID=3048013 RepID=A0AAE3QIG0_9BACT|nr:peptidylprolyl isomerase [Xanthocytophaga flavus]MDJ1479445.1 peptidylprolyl isomerase [Xanthocytophaga flavus]
MNCPLKLSFRIQLLVLSVLGVLLSCETKKVQETETDPAKIRITKHNVEQVLKQYGEEHKDSIISIETPYGIIKAVLYTKTPLHRASFIRLINKGYFDSADFYRLVPAMVIQGGHLDKRRMGLENYEIPHEIDPRWFHKRGALAMAHRDESEGSSPYDFYIVQGSVFREDSVRSINKDTGYPLLLKQLKTYTTVGGVPHLDYHYTVFGEVIEGLNLVDSIAAEPLEENTEHPKNRIPIRITIP